MPVISLVSNLELHLYPHSGCSVWPIPRLNVAQLAERLARGPLVESKCESVGFDSAT